MKNIRNFSIISHIDHGKSTLADRFLELTNTVPSGKMRSQFLDMMDLEREKGITIKMQPVRMEFQGYILNLIDTPGHVDFSYEVSRALAAAEGAVLLVDATKGIQAQTVSNLELAKKQGLVIVPVVNKIDSPQARVEEVKEELAQLLDILPEDVFAISAKTGENVAKLLEILIERIPCPSGGVGEPLRALIFDSKYNSFQGVIAYIRLVDGKVEAGQKIRLIQAEVSGEVKELGYFKPELRPAKELTAGEIGYLATGVKEPGQVRVGDTITVVPGSSEPLPGYKIPKPMVFASIYPEDADDFDDLKIALAQLKLNDASLVFEAESREPLGRGFRCGFLGALHAEIIAERLHREFDLNLVISTPSPIFKIVDKKNKEIIIYSPADWPDQGEINEIREPWVRLEVLTPPGYLGQVLKVLERLEGNYLETKYFGQGRALLIYEVPFREIISGFYGDLKGVSQGFASMNYEFLGERPADLVKLDILIAGEKKEAISKIVSAKKSQQEGRKIVEKLKAVLPPQLFSVPIQAALGGKVIARETLRAKGRDVIAPLYGGDYTRKRKLLEKQKKGKKKLAARGQVSIPQQVFLELFKTN